MPPMRRELALGMTLALESTEAELEQIRSILREAAGALPVLEDRAHQLLGRAKRRIETVRLALGNESSKAQRGLESHFIELELDSASYPERTSVAALVGNLSRLGAVDCIELAIAPGGGGRLCFIVHGEASAEELRERLLSMLVGGSIACCRPLPARLIGAD